MVNQKVSHNVVEMLVQLADRTGVSLLELSDGLGVGEAALRRLEALEWNLFTVMLDRLTDVAGYERLEVICENIPDINPGSRAMFTSFVSPRLLYRFVNTLMGPMMYPMLDTSYDERDGIGYVGMRLRDASLRDCHTLFKLMRPGQSSIGCFIGYPAVPVQGETTPRSAALRVTLPPSQTLVARASRRAQSLFWKSTLRELERDKARLKEANEHLWRARSSSLDSRLQAAVTRWSLTSRQRETLSGLARGLSNKQLARELGCSLKTVESHISELLKRSGAESRLRLVAQLWRDF